MTSHWRFSNFHPVTANRLDQERKHDAYKKPRGKLPEPTECPVCGAVYQQGRWQWLSKPDAKVHKVMCPACHRIHDNYPAGFVTLAGQFVVQHRDEVLHLIGNEEQKAKAEHPLKRIMTIEDDNGGLIITTTDIHLARRIGEALQHAYQGKLEYHYNAGEEQFRLHWER